MSQNKVDANVNRDVYTANPSCREFSKYEWIGKLMGACFRGRENLVSELLSVELSLKTMLEIRPPQNKATF